MSGGDCTVRFKGWTPVQRDQGHVHVQGSQGWGQGSVCGMEKARAPYRESPVDRQTRLKIYFRHSVGGR